MSERKLISSGSSFEKVAGYQSGGRGRRLDLRLRHHRVRLLTMTIAPDLESQTRQAFRNIASALEQAGASLDDVVRVHYYLARSRRLQARCTDLRRVPRQGAARGDRVVCGLVEPEMKIEIEVTARRSRHDCQRTERPGRLSARTRLSGHTRENMAAPIDFYFDFSSPYGYFAATRISALAAKYGRAWCGGRSCSVSCSR